MSPEEIDSLRIVLDPAGQAGVATALFFIMFGVALGLKVSDFGFLKHHRTVFFGGLATQTIGLPLATLALILLLRPAPSIALGMIVVACCPGGSSSNMLTLLARGDTAYSVALTTASSMLACIATPVAILFWSGLYGPTSDLLDTVDLDAGAFVLQTTALLGVPLALGMAARTRFPASAERARRSVAGFGAAALGGVILYGVAQFWPILRTAAPVILPIAILHNALAFGLGALAGTLLRTTRAKRRALVFEVGIQNSGLAIVILLAQLDGLGGAAAIACVWGVWHVVAGGIIVGLYRRADAARTTLP